mmetsp:Transcript_25687/g.74288  ORF Transcript_25687/g.74288 Transcript_25687/m.74288 type:complete len:517 (-) Transcript_25687:115-1665(-)
MAALLGGGSARSMRVTPDRADRNLPGLEGLTDEQAEKKLAEIRGGGDLRAENPPLPEERKCQDCIWLVLFLVLTCALVFVGFMHFPKIMAAVEHHRDRVTEGVDFPPLPTLLSAALAGTCGSLLAAFVYIMLAHRAPACVVWTSLFFGPFVLVVGGLALMYFGSTVAEGGMMLVIAGFVLLAIGLCQGACVLCCWRHLIPFMIKMTEVVSDVIEQHPCLLAVSLIGAILGFAWTMTCYVAFLGLYMANQDKAQEMMQVKQVKSIMIGVMTIIFVWGGLVASNICHVTYAGVFGRWYYRSPGEEAESPLMPSFKAAVTTSLGSICFGSFLVAFIRGMEAMVRSCKNDAASEGNYVMCIILCLLEMIISCIGDVLEYFNEWAYIQCAIRGVSFIQAAKITYSMITCANVQFIISDLLLNSLVTLGSLLCAVAGAVAGGATGYALDGSVAAVWGTGIGFFVGIMAGAASLNIISSGVKTILACWADDPQPFAETHPEIHAEFEAKIYGKITGQPAVSQY